MKKIILFLAITVSLVLTSCQGDPGPPGQDGGVFFSQVFETTLNFNASNSYAQLVSFNGIEVFESDVVLVYLLNGQTDDGLDIWTPLPQTFFPPQGTLLYSFDHTYIDANIFLDANFDLNTLGTTFTNNKTFRIAIVPAEFANANLTMDQVLEMSQNGVQEL